MTPRFVLLFLTTVSLLQPSAHCQQTACGAATNSVDITFEGPSPAPECRFDYIVSLRHPRFGTHLCTGTLIAPSWVLTTASCARKTRELPTARINGYIRDGAFEEVVPTTEVVVHEDFTGSESLDPFDVALYKLAQLSMQPTVSLTRSAVATGRTVEVVGWGRVRSQGALSDVLQLGASLEIVPCTATWPSTKEGFACIDGFMNVACPSDAGSPVLFSGASSSSDIQVGIATDVMGDCGLAGRSAPFVEIAHLREWIDRQI